MCTMKRGPKSGSNALVELVMDSCPGVGLPTGKRSSNWCDLEVCRREGGINARVSNPQRDKSDSKIYAMKRNLAINRLL